MRLIDADEAVELIERMKPYHQDADDIAEMIANMPPAQPGWIPCSERMPKEKDAGILKKFGTNRRSDYVLATIEVKGERMTETICTHDGAWYWNKKYAFPDYKVVAWMPLPESYHPEGEGQEIV